MFNPSRQTRQILTRAKAIGPKTDELCQGLFELRGREAQKSMWGIIGLTSRYPNCVIEQAAGMALARHIRSYKGVRAIAEQLLAGAITQLDTRQGELSFDATSTPPLTQEHALIRNPTEYAEFFARSTAQCPSTKGESES